MSEDSEELNNESMSGTTSSYIVSNSGSMVFDAARRRYAYRFVKRLFDIIFSLIVCVVLFVPVGILCLAIVFDSSGSPIFAQKRVGRYGKPIMVLKLRTMFSDAHSCPEKYFTDAQMRQWKQEYKVEDDPRITRIGSFLRKTSLDELPQFLNVLKGDMSVIGCRPITEEELANFNEIDREIFLSQKMGITGWWQVTDRNNATWEDGTRQQVELYYV
ncbi:MAG: sugar transferase, partial [Eggerthellaceae bacterium]|nr:sugar transferase [Eggerthellaceae bacterium]